MIRRVCRNCVRWGRKPATNTSSYGVKSKTTSKEVKPLNGLRTEVFGVTR